MKFVRVFLFYFVIFFSFFVFSNHVSAALTLTAGSSATTTPSVATSITGFQIVGPSASTTPVKLRATSGTLTLSVVSGVTMSGNGTGTVNLSGTVTNLNTALSTLKYTRGSVGTDTLEVSLVNSSEVFFTDNGHLYQFVSGSYNWGAAKTAAEGQTAYGATGYLATITSLAENNFVYTRISGDGWLGATDSEVEKTWKWVTGPETGTSFFQENPSGGGGSAISSRFNAWAIGEPNDYSPGEDCAYMYASQSGKWNDFPCSASQGYVVEFGADGALPVVVASNISVVTADVPAVTSLSPTNGSTSASPTADLVIGFSKTVTKQTGNIIIRKSSDNSLVETIDASGGLVSGSGTNTITINPNATLEEGIQFYVTVPSTAFKDSSNNFFDGINASTTWVFTTADVTAPTISNIATTTATTTTTITWDTNELASTRIWYSANLLYASSTSEVDTSPRVLNHSASLSGLIACTFYNYKLVSRDPTLNTATSSSASFITKGCLGGAIPSASNSSPITVSGAATSTLTNNNRTLSVETPANFTATSSSIVIQIKSLSSDTVLGSIGKPNSSINSAAGIVFDVKALIDNTIELDSFDLPVTISYVYTDDDVTGLNEESLSMYHYANNTWSELDNCSVNTSTNTITCTAPHFSIFAIFGSPQSSNNSSSNSGTSMPWCSGPSAPGWNASLPYGGCGKVALATVEPIKFKTQDIVSCPKYNFTRSLRFGMKGEDVRTLQQLMNCLGFKLADDGPGSPGNETNLFVDRTFSAVKKFQENYSSDILAPINITKGTGIFAELSRKKIISLLQII
ncbi:MAG: lectin-like protein [Minisyncoccota bacterium]